MSGYNDDPPHGVECASCGLSVHDLPDEVVAEQGWMNIFEYVNGSWYCLGCDPEW